MDLIKPAMTPTFLLDNIKEIESFNHHVFNGWNKHYLNFRNYEIIEDIISDYPNNNILITKQDCINLYKDKSTLYKGVIKSMLWGGINSGRYFSSKRSNLHNILNYDRDILLNNILVCSDLIKNNRYGDALEKFSIKGPFNIKGIGTSYITKFFYFLGQSKAEIIEKPLILDKWTMNAYFLFLLQTDKKSAKSFIKSISFMLDNSPGDVKFKDGKQIFYSYQKYVEDMNRWSLNLGVTPRLLEEYVFGESLKSNKSFSNPRVKIWNAILSEWNNFIAI